MSNISLFSAPCNYFCLGLAKTHGAHYTWVEGLFDCQKAISVVRIIIGKLQYRLFQMIE